MDWKNYHRHMGSGMAMTGAGAAGGIAVGTAAGVPSSVLPSLINVSQGEESNYGEYVGNIAGSAAVGGAFGGAIGYSLPQGTGESWKNSLMQKADDKFSYANASHAGRRRAGAAIGAGIGLIGGGSTQKLMNLIHAFNNSTPEEVAQMI